MITIVHGKPLSFGAVWDNLTTDIFSNREPLSNIPAMDLPGYKSLFYKQARNENLDLSNKKTAILSQFSQYFETDGSYNVKLLKELGVADKDWWGW